MKEEINMANYVITFGKQKSGETPYGQKDAYPLSGANLGYGHRTYSGIGDKRGRTEMDTTYFGLLDKEETTFDQKMIQDLESYIRTLVTSKMDPDTITVMEVTTSDDSANYKINSSIEHTEALIGESNGAFIITSDTATLSTIPNGSDEATNKTELDFKNRRINGK